MKSATIKTARAWRVMNIVGAAVLIQSYRSKGWMECEMSKGARTLPDAGVYTDDGLSVYFVQHGDSER